MSSNSKIKDLKSKATKYPSWQLTERQLCDLELILNGAFYPLDGFNNKSDYESIITKMRLSNGTLWPIPITLDISKEFTDKCKDKITLRDKEGFPIAIITISDIWSPDKNIEAKIIYGTTDHSHPGVHYLIHKSNTKYVGGKIEYISTPHHYDYKNIRYTPENLVEDIYS